jgi:hypothetical protein
VRESRVGRTKGKGIQKNKCTTLERISLGYLEAAFVFLNIPSIKAECYYACSLRVRSIIGLLEKRRAIAPNP